jgi:hypothetical protein
MRKSIAHFIHSRFYCYSYAYGQLLVLALYRRYTEEGDRFVPRYVELLAGGGSGTPEELLARVDAVFSLRRQRAVRGIGGSASAGSSGDGIGAGDDSAQMGDDSALLLAPPPPSRAARVLSRQLQLLALQLLALCQKFQGFCTAAWAARRQFSSTLKLG